MLSAVPVLRPELPAFTTAGERKVWTLLRDQLRDEDLLLANLRITDRRKDHEIDIAVVLPGAAIVTVEVKGSTVWHDGEHWRQEFNRRDKSSTPYGRRVRASTRSANTSRAIRGGGAEAGSGGPTRSC
jgi:hypothetical protein